MKSQEVNNAEKLDTALLESDECPAHSRSETGLSGISAMDTPLPVSEDEPESERGKIDSDRPLVSHYTEDELIHLYDDKNPLLNYEKMVEACDAIFGKGTSISRARYLELTRDAYKIDMESYARKHNFTDAVYLAELVSQVSAAIRQSSANPTGRIAVVGCGQGRLAEVYIALAKRNGINTIVMNDLIEDHVEATREKIKKMYGTDGTEGKKVEGVNIEYVTGDILTADIPDNSVDAAYMWWFVGAEICDPSSSDAMLENRKVTCERIHRMLIPGGAWIDDMPDPNKEPGLYHLAAHKTAHILRERGILPGMENNLLLTNWSFEQNEGFPYQLRWMPPNDVDNKLRHRAGFRNVASESGAIPISSDHTNAKVVVSTLKSIKVLDRALDALQSQLRRTVRIPKRKDPLQRRRIIKWAKTV